jgi:hypothetical protein
MFKTIVEYIREIFRTRSEFYQLEDAIAASNPITQADIERVEREFWNKNLRSSLFDRYI